MKLPPVKRNGDVVAPIDPDGEVFYGVAPGTNGTAAAVHRALVAPNARWARSDGSRPRSLDIQPYSGQSSWRNPWY